MGSIQLIKILNIGNTDGWKDVTAILRTADRSQKVKKVFYCDILAGNPKES